MKGIAPSPTKSKYLRDFVMSGEAGLTAKRNASASLRARCVSVANANAEHMGANLLPCNAAGRLQARRRRDGFMAKIIEFYVPSKFRTNAAWIPPQQRGKVIEFRLPVKKSA